LLLDRQRRYRLTTPFGAQVPGTSARPKPSGGFPALVLVRRPPGPGRAWDAAGGRHGCGRPHRRTPACPPGSPSGAPGSCAFARPGERHRTPRTRAGGARVSALRRRPNRLPHPRRSAGRGRWRRITRCSRSPASASTTPSRGRATPAPVRHGRCNQGVIEVLITYVREVTASPITTGTPAAAGAGVARRHTGAIVVSAVPRSRPSA
jgi:hypothetical protein